MKTGHLHKLLTCFAQPPATVAASEPNLETILSSPTQAAYAHGGRLAMLALSLFILWAFLARLEEVSVAEGEVIPQEQIQAVQHLEGGIIEKIHVFEGDKVETGQPLIQLSLTLVAADRQEQEIKRQALRLKQARLLAEAEGKERLDFSDNLKDIRDTLKAAEHASFQSRQQKQASGLMVLKEQIQQKQFDIAQLETERDTLAANLGVRRERLRISDDLMRDKLTSQLEHLQLKSEVREMEGRLEVVKVAIPRAQAALAEAKEKLNTETLHFRNEARQELGQVETDLARIGEMLSKTDDQVNRTTIKSPITGVVKALRTHTLGGVVKPGETIMEIVPISEKLVIEAKLDPRDIGFVKVGQPALVKVLTYDYSRYGGLDGEVISISADSHTDKSAPNPHSYYRVVVRTSRNFLGDNAQSYPITPGMQATVDIKTGSKSVLQYLLKPVIKVKQEAFRER